MPGPKYSWPLARGDWDSCELLPTAWLLPRDMSQVFIHLLLSKRDWKSWLETQHSKNKDHSIQSHHFMGNRWGNSGNSVRLYFLGSKITADGDCSHEIKSCLLLGRKAMTNQDSILKSRDITLLTKVRLVKVIGFFSSYVWIWELDSTESWVPKYWCFWTVV